MTLKLHAYQERAIDFCLDKQAAYLAIDLGMGKTAIALHTIKRTGKPAFVFCPLSTLYTTWPDEIAKWTPDLSYKILHGPYKSVRRTENVDILLMNYEGLPWLAKQKAKWRRRSVIYDEASKAKSHSTDRFKMLRKMHSLWTAHRLCLSATPSPNSLADLWAQYYLLDRGMRLGKNISQFRDRYCRPYSYPGMVTTLYKVDPRFERDIYDAVTPITYRLDAKDYLELPPITYNEIKCVLPATLEDQYLSLERDFVLELEDTFIETPTASTLWNKLHQFVQGGVYTDEKVWRVLHNIKLRALEELVDTSMGQPILCAIQYRGELEMIKKLYPKAPVIAGGTPPKLTRKYFEQWNGGDIPLMLCHPASLSHGVNLQAGGHILLWYGLPWSLEQYLQLNGRLYRQGQQRGVFIHHLIMQNTIDEIIVKALRMKNIQQNNFFDHVKQYMRQKYAH